MKQRPYQAECLREIAVNLSSGVNRQLVVLPTASGKTIIFSQLPSVLNMQRPDKMLVLVQAEELCWQACEKIRKCNPTLRVGLEKAEYSSSIEDDIVVASIQSLSGTKTDDDGNIQWGKRLLSMPRNRFRYVVVDECHHITSASYAGPLRYFGVYKPDPKYNDPGKLLLGVTATPNRTDNKGLEGFFDSIVFSRDIRTMIKDGWLADLKPYRVDTTVNLDNVSVSRGDFVTGQLEKAVNEPARNKLIVDKYLELGEGSPFLAFTVDIQHTIDLTDAFRERGIECYGIASKSDKDSPWLITNSKDRQTAIQKYNSGEIRGLLSCQALLEGFDAPRATVALHACPTKSGLRYIQSMGRVLRPFPAPEERPTWAGWTKDYAISLDFVDLSSRHSLIAAPTLFGLKANFDMKGKAATGVIEEVERIKASKPAINLELYKDLDTIRGVAEKIDLFSVPTIPGEVREFSQFSWVTGVASVSYQLVLPDKGILSIRQNTLGKYEIYRNVNGVRTQLGESVDIKSALQMADREIPRDAMILLRNDSNWRRLQPSEAQISLIRKLYPEMRRVFASDAEFAQMVAAKYSRGDASSLISARSKGTARRR